MKYAAPKELTLLVYNGMWRPGGIQSLIIRLLNANINKTVWVVCDRNDIIPKHLQSRTVNTKSLIDASFIGGLVEKPPRLNIITFGPPAAAVGYLAEMNINRIFSDVETRMTTVVLHPQEFMMQDDSFHLHLMNKCLGRAIGTSRFTFMNEHCLKTHAPFFSRDLTGNSVVPVPIDSREVRWQSRAKEGPLRIVSVGRIVSFKAYNFVLPRIIADFQKKGWDISCDIFGYGTEEADLIRSIQESGAAPFVSFKGPIALEDFDDIVPRYDLFIGMGTAALQAAQLGVPTLLSIINDPDGAHGFIQDAPFGNLGEQDEDVARQNLGKLIEMYLDASPAERQRISEIGAAFANRYVGHDYIESVSVKTTKQNGIRRTIAGLFCRFYVWLESDNWLRAMTRYLRKIYTGESR